MDYERFPFGQEADQFVIGHRLTLAVSGRPSGPRGKCLLRFFARRAPAVVRPSGAGFSPTKTIPTQ
jgi:hypothetical protein